MPFGKRVQRVNINYQPPPPEHLVRHVPRVHIAVQRGRYHVCLYPMDIMVQIVILAFQSRIHMQPVKQYRHVRIFHIVLKAYDMKQMRAITRLDAAQHHVGITVKAKHSVVHHITALVVNNMRVQRGW